MTLQKSTSDWSIKYSKIFVCQSLMQRNQDTSTACKIARQPDMQICNVYLQPNGLVPGRRQRTGRARPGYSCDRPDTR